MKHFTILAAILLCVACNYNGKTTTPTNKSVDTAKDLYYVEKEDPGMNAAITKARTSTGKFDSAFKSNNTHFTDFAVKKRYKIEDGGGEHIWVAITDIVDGKYKGYINNDVEKTKEVKYGDTVFVSRNEISDWMYLDHNILRGGFTMREARNNMSPSERAKMDKEIGFKIKD